MSLDQSQEAPIDIYFEFASHGPKDIKSLDVWKEKLEFQLIKAKEDPLQPKVIVLMEESTMTVRRRENFDKFMAGGMLPSESFHLSAAISIAEEVAALDPAIIKMVKEDPFMSVQYGAPLKVAEIIGELTAQRMEEVMANPDLRKEVIGSIQTPQDAFLNRYEDILDGLYDGYRNDETGESLLGIIVETNDNNEPTTIEDINNIEGSFIKGDLHGSVDNLKTFVRKRANQIIRREDSARDEINNVAASGENVQIIMSRWGALHSLMQQPIPRDRFNVDFDVVSHLGKNRYEFSQLDILTRTVIEAGEESVDEFEWQKTVVALVLEGTFFMYMHGEYDLHMLNRRINSLVSELKSEKDVLRVMKAAKTNRFDALKEFGWSLVDLDEEWKR